MKACLVLLAALCASGQAVSYVTEVDALYPELSGVYQDLHQHPELAFSERRTAGILAARLRALGFDVTEGVGRTGIVGLLRNGNGPTVMMRTELDALPVKEATGAAFASSVVAKNAAGEDVPVMHACGHDLHMTAWLGTATLLAKHKDIWRGTLMMVGQPGEEGAGGAIAMLNDGLFTRFPKPNFALSVHDDDSFPSGQIGYRAGFFRARSDSLNMTIFGRGGHAAMPQNTVDPIVLASRIVVALQTIISRENNPSDPVVITVGSIHGGTQANIISDEVKLQLSVRTPSDAVYERVRSAIERIAKAEAESAGAPRLPTIQHPSLTTNPVYNDAALTARIAPVLKKALGEANVAEMAAKMTSEDFSEYGRAGVPALLLQIGAVPAAKLAEAKRTGIPVPAPHSPEWLPELEPTLKGAIRTEVAAILELLGRP